MRTAALHAALLMACALACRGSSFDRDALDIRERTVPLGATLVASWPVARTAWSAEATWEVDVPMRWEEYVEHVRSRLPGFTRTGPAVFSRTSGGDMQTLRLEASALVPPLRVHVTFTASAT